MDEPCQGQERRQTIEMPLVLTYLSEIAERTMLCVRNPSHTHELELACLRQAAQIICEITKSIELRDIQQGLRHNAQAIARSQHPWD